MLKAIQNLEKKIDNEKKILVRCGKEVTRDWQEDQAEHRLHQIYVDVEVIYNMVLRWYEVSPRPVIGCLGLYIYGM